MNKILIIILSFFPTLVYSDGIFVTSWNKDQYQNKIFGIIDKETYQLELRLHNLSHIGFPGSQEYWNIINDNGILTVSYVIKENATRFGSLDNEGISLNNQLLYSNLGVGMGSPNPPSPIGYEQVIKLSNGSESSVFSLPPGYAIRNNMIYHTGGGALGMRNTWRNIIPSADVSSAYYYFYTESIITDASSYSIGQPKSYSLYMAILATRKYKTLHLKTDDRVVFENIVQAGVAKETDIKLLQMTPVFNNTEGNVRYGIAEFIMESVTTAECGSPRIKFDSGTGDNLEFNTYYDLAQLNQPLGVQWVSSGNCPPGTVSEMRRFTVRYQ